MKDSYFVLANGNRIPKLGLGTDDVFFINPPRHSNNKVINKFLNAYNYRILKPYLNSIMAKRFVKAFRAGYRLIDTSAAYNNEKSIGDAIRMSGIPREEFFVTSRCTNHSQFENKVRESFFLSLKKFGLDYLDLYMFHWPVTNYYLDTWKELESLYKKGYIRNLGVANCNIHHLQELLSVCNIKPVINQIEVHPLFTQKKLIGFCKEQGIQVEAYSPLAKNDDRLRHNRVIGTLAEKYGKSRSQIIIRWHIDNGIIPIPRSMHVCRMIQNLDVFDFKLLQDEVEAIDAININSRLRYDPDNCDFTLL